MHLHSADYHLLVVEGTMKHWLRGASVADARSLGPGSYWFQPGGQVHADACLSESCLVFLVWSGQRDGKLAPPEPAR
jgi:quercetin dioxygenase-like cupin family protein